MDKEFYKRVKKYCTPGLLNFALRDEKNKRSRAKGLHVDSFLEQEKEIKFQNLKVCYVIDKIGGRLFRNGKRISYSELVSEVDDPRSLSIARYWENTEHNGDMILYGWKNQDVPERLPQF
jgi:hypothetical protein